jgi:hypothetical protein
MRMSPAFLAARTATGLMLAATVLTAASAPAHAAPKRADLAVTVTAQPTTVSTAGGVAGARRHTPPGGHGADLAERA